jgi:uncharacterized protein (TIGR03118 family)
MRQFRYAMATLVGLSLMITSSASALAASVYEQTNLVSSLNLPGVRHDDALKNPWGLGFGANTPFWVGDQKTGVSTLYNANGTSPPIGPVVIPPGPGTGNVGPTGVVNNANINEFKLTGGNGASANFIFATLNGTIAAWNGTLGTTGPAEQEFQAANGAVFTGLALASNGTQDQLYAADNQNNAISVFGPDFKGTTAPGGFLDPNLPSGAKVYNIQSITINGVPTLVVTYQGSAGNNAVDYFDTNGNFLKRLTTDSHLSSPWGLALAPPGFGSFGGDLLVGNKGNGQINAFDPISGAFIGTLMNSGGLPITNVGLWGLAFRTGASFDPNTLYFAAGVNGAGNFFNDGIFGTITVAPVPEPSSAVLLGLGTILLCGVYHREARRRRGSARARA